MIEGRVHFIGAGGYGMRPLAAILLKLGNQVSGSDIKDSAGLRELEEMGAQVWLGHNRDAIASSSAVIYSNAVPEDDPELSEARRLGIRVLPRADLLAMLFNSTRGIGVTGTHGKTTTTAMLTYILIEAGFDPMALVGSGLPDMPTGGRYGAGPYMVVEADEAYGTFLKLRPYAAIITNVDDDHRDHYGTYEAIKEAFGSYSASIRQDGLLVVCSDSQDAVEAARRASCRIVRYGLTEEDGYGAKDVAVSGFGSEFTVQRRGAALGRLKLAVPGMHNITNALGAAAAALEIGVPFESIRNGILAYKGADRRCQRISDLAGIAVIDDYAHHPEEVKATLSALRTATPGRLIAIFQPQRFSRTQLLMDRFATAFSDADYLLVTDVYYKGTGEQPIEGVSGKVLAGRISEARGSAVEFADGAEAAALWALAIAKRGDTVVTMGAGDIWRATRIIAERLKESEDDS